MPLKKPMTWKPEEAEMREKPKSFPRREKKQLRFHTRASHRCVNNAQDEICGEVLAKYFESFSLESFPLVSRGGQW